MKQLCIVLAILARSTLLFSQKAESCLPNDSLVTTYYESGKKRSEELYVNKNYKRNYTMEYHSEWYENGTQKNLEIGSGGSWDRIFAGNSSTDRALEWYPNGLLQSSKICNRSDSGGLLICTYFSFYNNGHIRSMMIQKGGCVNDFSAEGKQWNINGIVEEETYQFRDSITRKKFYPSGKEKLIVNASLDKEKRIYKSENGKVITIECYEKNKLLKREGPLPNNTTY